MQGHEGGFRGNSKSGRAKQKYLLENQIEEIEVFVCFQPGFLNFLQKKKNQLPFPKYLLNNALMESEMIRCKNLEESILIGFFNPVLNTKLAAN
jgi:hypothetical protein